MQDLLREKTWYNKYATQIAQEHAANQKVKEAIITKHLAS